MSKFIRIKVWHFVAIAIVGVATLLYAQSRYLAPVSNQALFLKGLKAYSDQELYFRDTGIYIESSADGQLDIVSDGTINISGRLVNTASVADTNVFTTTAETDTVTIAGVTTSSIFVVSGMFTSAVDQQDVLQWEAIDGALVVHRLAAGETGLKYSWHWLR